MHSERYDGAHQWGRLVHGHGVAAWRHRLQRCDQRPAGVPGREGEPGDHGQHACAGDRRRWLELLGRGERSGWFGHILQLGRLHELGVVLQRGGPGGTCTVKYDQVGSTNYNAAPQVTEAVTVTAVAAQEQDQTISFGALAGKAFGDADFSVSATASSGLAVSFAASGNCTVTGTTVHLASAGSCTITASQAGNANYNAASPVGRTFTIGKPSIPAPSCAVPKVAGKPLAAAKLALTSHHCRTGAVRRAYSKKVKKGIVISQSRRAGQKLAANTKVDLVVSKGRAPVVAPSGAGQLKAVVDRLETILQSSAASRRTLAAALTAGFGCSATPRATAQRIAAVVAARQALLRQLRSVKAPAQMRSLLELLDRAFQQSIAADSYYRAGFLAIGSPEAGCPCRGKRASDSPRRPMRALPR